MKRRNSRSGSAVQQNRKREYHFPNRQPLDPDGETAGLGTYLLLPLVPKEEEELQAVAAQLTDTLMTQ